MCACARVCVCIVGTQNFCTHGDKTGGTSRGVNHLIVSPGLEEVGETWPDWASATDRQTDTQWPASQTTPLCPHGAAKRGYSSAVSAPLRCSCCRLSVFFFFFLSSPQLIFILSQRCPVTIEPLCAPTQHSCVPRLPLLHMTSGAAFEPPRPSLPASV